MQPQGGVRLEAFSLPGHVVAEIGFFEHRSRTLLLGDALPGIDWPLFHGHVRPAVLRQTLHRLRALTEELSVERVCLAHYPVLVPAAFLDAIAAAEHYVDGIDEFIAATIRESAGGVTVTEVWEATYHHFGKEREFRGLAMVECHLEELRARGLLARIGAERFAWADRPGVYDNHVPAAVGSEETIVRSHCEVQTG